MITVKGIHKKFGRFAALSDVSLQCDAGQCIALIGPNGCGKTTLIKTVLGMVVPDKGEILFDGKTIRNDVAYRSRIGYMPQIGRYPENMTVGQVIETIRALRNDAAVTDNELYEAYKLKDILSKRMNTLSGGMRQKVSATLAFQFDPQVLILDEPTAGLDPLASEILKDKIIAERNKGKLILITSHILSELDELVSEIIFMQDGVLRFHKKIAQLKTETGEERISKAISSILRKEAV